MNSLRRFVIYLAVAAASTTAACSGAGDNDAAGKEPPAAGAHDDHGTDVAVATCDGHGADAALCYFCDPALRDPERLWCAEHDRYEDRCLICHPEIRDTSRLYCNEHGTYEDECFICHPDLFKKDNDDGASNPPVDNAVAVAGGNGLYCSEHDVDEAQCGICHPELTNTLVPGGGLKIRFPSTTSAARAGVATSFPTLEVAGSSVRAVGEVGYNLNRLARVTPLVDGVVREVHADLGDDVEAGQALVTVASPGVAEAKSVFLSALAEETVATRTMKRETTLFEGNVSAERDLIDARAALATATARRAAAEQNLLDLGFTRSEVTAIASNQSPGSTVTLRARFAGTIVARNAVAGDVVSMGTELMRVADLDEFWVTIAVPERDVAGIEAGQPVEVRSETAGIEAHGMVRWVSSHLNETTRMAEIRAAIANPDRKWKAGMFVNCLIETSFVNDVLAVPADAVHRFGGQPFVFVETSGGLYEVRRIDVSGLRGDQAIVTAGLQSEERIVTSQSFLVKSEFQKSRLGAGCVD